MTNTATATAAQLKFLQQLADRLRVLNGDLTTPGRLLEWMGFPTFPTKAEASAAIVEAKKRVKALPMTKAREPDRVWMSGRSGVAALRRMDAAELRTPYRTPKYAAL